MVKILKYEDIYDIEYVNIEYMYAIDILQTNYGTKVFLKADMEHIENDSERLNIYEDGRVEIDMVNFEWGCGLIDNIINSRIFAEENTKVESYDVESKEEFVGIHDLHNIPFLTCSCSGFREGYKHLNSGRYVLIIENFGGDEY